MNTAEDFRRAIESKGLTPPVTIFADGKLHRFASNGDREDDSGWYVYFPDGQPAGAFGCWRLGVKENWSAKSETTMSETERAAHRQRLEATRQQRDTEERRRHAEAAAWAQDLWEHATPASASHPYLQRKQAQPHGLKIHSENVLLIPVRIKNTITSLQLIDEDGTKKFLPGGAVTGGYFLIGDPTDAAIIAVGEGFSTCASVHEATGYPTVCAFSAGNLVSVATQLRQEFPTVRIVVVGDNDLSGTGQRAARTAAEAVNGVAVVPEEQGQDFNDLHAQRGLEAVSAAIKAVLTHGENAEAVTTPSQPVSMDREPEIPAPFTLVTAPDSFISQYVKYATTRTDAPAEAHEALAFGILSVAASHVRLPIATSPRGWSLVLWVLYLVNSTAGRKSTVIDLAIDLVREVVGEEALVFWEGSPQGLLQRLQARDGEATVFVRDEYASLMAAFNKNGHLSGLPQVLIKAFDGSPLENIRTKKKGPDGEKHSDTDRVEHPYLAQFAAAPWDAFIQRATVDNLLDGFLPRFIVITGAAAGRPLPLLTPSITAARATLYAQLSRYALQAQSIQHVVLSPEVLEAQWSLEQTFLRRAETSGRPDAAGPSLKRLAETALKVAALLAIEDATNGVLSIRIEHFTLASLIATRWADSSVRLVEALGATSFQKECTSVFQTIQQRPGVSVSLLYRTHRRLRKREFDEILDALDLQGRIRIEAQPTSTPGRPPRLVYPIGGAAL